MLIYFYKYREGIHRLFNYFYFIFITKNQEIVRNSLDFHIFLRDTIFTIKNKKWLLKNKKKN